MLSDITGRCLGQRDAGENSGDCAEERQGKQLASSFDFLPPLLRPQPSPSSLPHGWWLMLQSPLTLPLLM